MSDALTWEACAAIVEKADPDRFLSAMTAAPEDRAALFPLYAFNVEVARAPWVTSEPGLAEIRLQWWRDALDEIFAGRGVRRHEVVTPLAEVIGAHDLPRYPFEALIDARAFDIYADGHAGRPALDAYLDATAGGLMRLAVRATGEARDTLAGHVGWAQGAAGLLRALPALWSAGRDPLPVPGGLPRQEVLDRRLPEPVAEAVRTLARDGLARLDRIEADRLTDGQRAALRAGWRSRDVLRRIAAEPAAIFTGVEVSEFRRRGGLTWRALTGRF